MNIWPLIYQFAVGGIIFLLGLVISWKSGDYSKKRKSDRLVTVYMLVGVSLYLVFQIIWHVLASQT